MQVQKGSVWQEGERCLQNVALTMGERKSGELQRESAQGNADERDTRQKEDLLFLGLEVGRHAQSSST